MAYSWIITEDHMDGTDKGVSGPNGSTHDWEANPNAGQPFQMFDDDGELYYTGRYVGDDSEDMFKPLDDFGEPNAGCTGIKYKDSEGDWEYI